MLEVKIADNIFKNPLFVASGTYGYGNETSDIVDIDKIGAIITKSVTRLPREGNPPPRIIETRSGMLNSIGLANLGVDSYCKEKVPYLNSINTNFIINIAGTTIDDYLEILEILEKSNSNHVGYEVNISCPNVKEGGMEFGVSASMTAKLTSALRERTKKIIIMKLSPNVTDIVRIGKAAEDSGADAVSAINTVVGMAIDINRKAPVLNTIFGGLSGPAIKPVALAAVYKLYKNIKIPVIGIGGISSIEDAIEFFMAGASMIQIGTMNYTHPGIAIDIADGVMRYLQNNNISSIHDLTGSAH